MNKEEENNLNVLKLQQEQDFKKVIKYYYKNEISEEEINYIYDKLMNSFDIKTEEDLFNVLNDLDNDGIEDEPAIEEEKESTEDDTQESVVEDKQPEKEVQVIKEVVKEPKTVKESSKPKEAQEENKNIKKDKKNQPKDTKKLNKKNLFIIIGTAVLLIIISIVLVIVFSKPKDEDKKEDKTTATTWKDVLKTEAKDGSLKKKLEDKLDDFNITTEDVDLMLMDIDSDNDAELIAHVSNKKTNKLLTYEIDKKISYSKDYDLSSDDALGFVYNTINENTYWYINSDSDKTVISVTDKDVSDEDFTTNYYVLTNQYKDKNVLDQSIEVSLDNKDLSKDMDKVIKNNLTNKEFMSSNNLTIKKIKQEIKANEEEKLAEEEKKKQEEEQKALEEQKKQEEEQKKAEEEKKKQEASSSKSFEIVDTSLSDSSFNCPQVEEVIYKDSKNTYSLPCQKSDHIVVKYSDGSVEMIKTALNNGNIKITDLKKFNIQYYTDEN